MRLKIRHLTSYAYGLPAHSAIQTLRLTPRNHAGQFVKNWRLELDADYRLVRDEDAFGNIVHLFSIAGPIRSMSILVEGEVETRDMAGIVQGTAERLPLGLWLRETSLSMADAALKDFAKASTSSKGNDPLTILHSLNQAVFERMEFLSGPTDSPTSASLAFASTRGGCQDFAQIFIACARHLKFPARYVGGYVFQGEDGDPQQAGHAWAEAYVPNLGWVGFDPAEGISVTDHYVRVATGLDSLDAAPIRGALHGGADETLGVEISVLPGRVLMDG